MNSIHLTEQPLPGLGQRYALELLPGELLDVVVLGDGRRQLARRSVDRDTADVVLDLDRAQAITVGALLFGTSISRSTPDHDDEGAADEMAVETVTVTDGSPVIGRSAADALTEFGDGVVALAVIRGDTPHTVGPDAALTLVDGDRLVFAARRGDHGSIIRAVTDPNAHP